MKIHFPKLVTERLVLRSMMPGDTDFVYHHFSDPAVYRYLVDEQPVQTRAQAQSIVDFYTESSGISYNRWILELRSDKRPVGTCGYHQWHKSHHRAEIGYDLEEASWGKGLMIEALEAVFDFGFEKMALNRIEAMIHPDNVASLKLLERLGFVKEGKLREYYYQNSRYYDHCLLALLRGDWLGEKR